MSMKCDRHNIYIEKVRYGKFVCNILNNNNVCLLLFSSYTIYGSDPASFNLFTACSNKRQDSFKTERVVATERRTDEQKERASSVPRLILIQKYIYTM